MDWIEQNLDAYRVIAEILTDIRPLVRDRLETAHGKEWFRDGIPEDVFERLIRNKEKETSIDWYENRYQEVISYSVFPDLFEIIIANPGLFEPILKLAPSQSLLNTRFLELEVMRSKIGRARQVSEAEINFLTSFHLRFRRAVQDLKESPVDPEVAEASRAKAAEAAAARAEAAPTEEPSPAPAAEEKPRPADEPDRDRPPQRMAAATAEPRAPKAADEPTEAAEEQPVIVVEEEVDDDQAASKPRGTASSIVKHAMENNDDQGVLREIYREVTGIAEVIWTTEEIPTTAIWDRVSTNPWYEANFSKLGLRPLSDFYELISQVRAKKKAGVSKAEVQTFLNDSKFAQILLALRDLFQNQKI
jgi:hypothetical protein